MATMDLPGGFDPGRLRLLSPDPQGNHSGGDEGWLADGSPNPTIAWTLLAVWLVPVVIYWLWDSRRKQATRVIETGGEAEAEEARAVRGPAPKLGCSVLLASVEHSTPWTEALPQARTQKVQAGGLGVVVRLVAQHHPLGGGDHRLIMVHPMVSGPIDYGAGQEEQQLEVFVDGRKECVKVFSYEYHRDGASVKYLLVRHRLFTDRVWKADPPELYPNPMTRTKVLCFYALWNQAVGALLRRYKPDIYHCPDFHAALAPWHAIAPGPESHPSLRVLLVLHNAEYQGSISTDMAMGAKARRLAAIFGVPEEFFERHMVHDGRLTMLKAVVDFCAERQHGRGVCAVSDHYAGEVEQLYDLFWHLPRGGVRGLPNPMLEEDRARVPLQPPKGKVAAAHDPMPDTVARHLASGESPELSVADLPPHLCKQLGGTGDQAPNFVWLHEHLDCLQGVKAAAKCKVQKLLGLRENPEARLFVSLGRIVRQKGVDLIAEIAQWLLETYEDAQLVVIGPDEDGFGAFARARLEGLQDDFQGRLFCHFQFWRAPQALKLAADFCLMPSRDEPFGYVDVEFAWNGALVVGAQAGGLGKVPGFYYVAQNRENLDRLQRELRTVVTQAMTASHEQPDRIARMSRQAVLCRFPVGLWQHRLLRCYDDLLCTSLPSLAPGEAEGCARQTTSDGTELLVPNAFRTRLLPPEPPEQGGGEGAPPALADENGGSTAWEDNSWLLQELSEVELKERIVEHLTVATPRASTSAARVRRCSAQRHERIDEILEVVGTDEDRRRERQRAQQGQGHWLSEWLLRSTWGVHRIHWVVASGFVCMPAGQLLAWVVATELAVRSTGLPKWVPKISGPVDPTMVSLTLFVLNAAPQAGCALLWARLCRHHRAKALLSWAMLLNLVLLVPFLIQPQPDFIASLVLMAFAGVISSASMLFVVFNFMMSIRADVSQAALRMGRLEIARSFLQWILQAFILFAAPSSVLGTKEEPMPYQVLVKIIPLGVLVLITSFIPGVLVLFAPRPYRDDRFPGWHLGMLPRKPSFLILMLADCIGGLAAYPSNCYISWWLANGHSLMSLGQVSIVIAVVFSAAIGLWARALSSASVHGFSLLIAVVVFLAPPALLRAVAMEEVSTLNFLKSSNATLLLSAMTVLLDGVRSSALWAAKIRILGSRWRLLSWGSLSIALQQGCAFISPLFCELIARFRNNSSFITRNQKELADAMIVSIVPLGCLQYALQLLSILFIHRDLGLAPLRIPRRLPAVVVRLPCCRRQRFAKRAPALVAGLLGVVLALGTVFAMAVMTEEALPYDPVLRCYDLPEAASGPPCPVLKVIENHIEFGLNQFGQPTSARQRCLQRMRNAGGDSFALFVGERCQVMQCKSKDGVMAAGKVEGAEVFSRYCSIYGQNLVIVHLFEWSWNDIAQECRDYLGPAGFDAVQVSPPTEHILGPFWYTRYQPVSYTLDSRGGTESEFRYMVSECRNAGVSILVDAVINHMAGPYPIWPEEVVGKECDGKGDKFTECYGWTGTRFGSRLFEHGSAHYTRAEFHHYQGDILSNCVIPPFYNNRHLCDLSALPDLDTEQFQVQDKLRAYLFHLYEIGVTMFRIDAAMCMYPTSLGQLLQDLPLDYIYQEYYADLFKFEKHTMDDALTISPVTDFDYGWQMADLLFDYLEDGKWTSREDRFGELLRFGMTDGKYPEGVLPVSRGLQFLDNHDQQRERWKPENLHHGVPPNATCPWDGENVKPCRPIYKHGKAYSLAMLYTLAWPRGDSMQIMSSFAWNAFPSGPPGTGAHLHRGGTPEPVWQRGKLVGCRSRPTTSPVDEAYDNDTKRPWVCEHRWAGVAGLVRLRKSFGQGDKERAAVVNTFSEGPHVAFGLDNVAFLALHRGFNWDTNLGNKTPWSLVGLQTPLPPGTYCDLAQQSQPLPAVPKGQQLALSCSHVVVIGPAGNVTNGTVEPGEVMAVHHRYLASEAVEERTQLS